MEKSFYELWKLEVTTGTPAAIASRTGIPKPSYNDGNAKSCASL